MSYIKELLETHIIFLGSKMSLTEMGAAWPSEKLLSYRITTQSHIPEDRQLKGKSFLFIAPAKWLNTKKVTNLIIYGAQ
jgi:hypothetical protein